MCVPNHPAQTRPGASGWRSIRQRRFFWKSCQRPLFCHRHEVSISVPVQIHARRSTDDMDHQLRHISPISVNNPLTLLKKIRKFARSSKFCCEWFDCGGIVAKILDQKDKKSG
jgi:hypothetical protein